MSIKDIYTDTAEVVEGEIKLREAQVKAAYDELESLSAKVKLWIKVNRVRLFIDAGVALVAFLIGVAL